MQAKTLEYRLESAINDSAKTNWRALNLSYNFALSRKISAELSANYTAVSVDGAGSESRIRPGVRLFLAPSRRLVASVGYSSGFDYLPWKNALASNNYLANGTRPLPEDIKWKVAANIDWQVSKGFVFKAKYENKRIDGLNYFLRDSLGTFALHSGDFKLGLASVGGLLTFSDAMKLEFSLSIFDDALQVGETFDNLIDVPYRGAFRAPVTLTLSPRENLTFETSLAWIGARRTALMQVVEAQGENPRFQELPAYLYTSIHASLQFSRHFEAFAQANNLFDDNFDGWQGYREMGINGLIGLKYIW